MPKRGWSKKARQAWWNSLDSEQQQAKIEHWTSEKAKRQGPAPAFDHRTKLPFEATIRSISGPTVTVTFDRVDGELVVRGRRLGPGLLRFP